jgi:hypothetical protein
MMARGMIPGRMPMQGTTDPATAMVQKSKGAPPPMNKTAPPKGKKLPAKGKGKAPAKGGNPFAKAPGFAKGTAKVGGC